MKMLWVLEELTDFTTVEKNVFRPIAGAVLEGN